MTTRHSQLKREWKAFHEEHPEVWELYCKFTFDRIRRGFQNYSSDAVFHRIRWEMAQPAYKKGEEFKLNDHFTAFYSRAFMKAHPKYDGFFRTRTQTSQYNAPSNLPPLGPEYLDSR